MITPRPPHHRPLDPGMAHGVSWNSVRRWHPPLLAWRQSWGLCDRDYRLVYWEVEQRVTVYCFLLFFDPDPDRHVLHPIRHHPVRYLSPSCPVLSCPEPLNQPRAQVSKTWFSTHAPSPCVPHTKGCLCWHVIVSKHLPHTARQRASIKPDSTRVAFAKPLQRGISSSDILSQQAMRHASHAGDDDGRRPYQSPCRIHRDQVQNRNSRASERSTQANHEATLPRLPVQRGHLLHRNSPYLYRDQGQRYQSRNKTGRIVGYPSAGWAR